MIIRHRESVGRLLIRFGMAFDSRSHSFPVDNQLIMSAMLQPRGEGRDDPDSCNGCGHPHHDEYCICKVCFAPMRSRGVRCSTSSHCAVSRPLPHASSCRSMSLHPCPCFPAKPCRCLYLCAERKRKRELLVRDNVRQQKMPQGRGVQPPPEAVLLRVRHVPVQGVQAKEHMRMHAVRVPQVHQGVQVPWQVPGEMRNRIVSLNLAIRHVAQLSTGV